MSQTVIKSGGRKDIRAVSLFEAKYNKVKLSDVRAKKFDENPGVWSTLVKFIDECSLPDLFGDEQVPSTYVYPGNYAAKPIGEQLGVLTRIFRALARRHLEFR